MKKTVYKPATMRVIAMKNAIGIITLLQCAKQILVNKNAAFLLLFSL